MRMCQQTAKLGSVEPHWLDEREMRAWRGFHRLRAELVAHLSRELARDSGLTDAGMAAIEAAAPGHAAAVRHCFADVLTPEQLDTLGDIAEAITTHLASEHADTANGDENLDTRAPSRMTRARSRS